MTYSILYTCEKSKRNVYVIRDGNHLVKCINLRFFFLKKHYQRSPKDLPIIICYHNIGRRRTLFFVAHNMHSTRIMLGTQVHHNFSEPLRKQRIYNDGRVYSREFSWIVTISMYCGIYCATGSRCTHGYEAYDELRGKQKTLHWISVIVCMLWVKSLSKNGLIVNNARLRYRYDLYKGCTRVGIVSFSLSRSFLSKKCIIIIITY